MEFKAKKLDLDLELTTLTGEVVSLTPRINMSKASSCIKIANEWKLLEDNNKNERKGPNKKTGLDIIAIQLSILYPKEKQWFMENFDIVTLKEVLIHVAHTVAGIQKK